MKYFLDSAKIDEVRYAYEYWGIDGVTTNPRHVYDSGKPFRRVIEELADQFAGTSIPVSVEIDPHIEETHQIVAAARSISSISPCFVIKIACTEQGLSAARLLQREGVRTNVTLVFSASQAIQAGRIGAAFVSPFVAWKEASGEDCRQLIEDIVAIYDNYDFSTEIIVAAIRTAKQICDAAIAGAHIVTAGFDVYRDGFSHPFTKRGMEIFSEAWDKTDTSGM